MKIHTSLLAVGFILTALGGVLDANTPAGNANIGAGLIFLVGLVAGTAGLVLAVVILLTHRSARQIENEGPLESSGSPRRRGSSSVT